MSVKKCYCGAKWRHNYPHGRKSNRRLVVIKEHDKECDYNRKNRHKRRWKR